MTDDIFHIATAGDWARARVSGAHYRPESLATVGYIHCSAADQVAGTLAGWFAGRADLVLLRIAVDRLTSPLVWEPGARGEAERFPHLYGPLPVGAVIAATTLSPDVPPIELLTQPTTISGMSTQEATPWTPGGWRDRVAAQQPAWPDQAALTLARTELASLPPLVFADEARSLRAALARVAAGEAVLLQAGDCAESFHDHTAASIEEKLRVMLQMAIVLTYGAGLPVVKVGRIAGQFAKPRSADTEIVDGVEVPSFRGHIVSDDAPTVIARTPDPRRLLQAYHQSAATLNLLRAFTKGGFADLGRVHSWNQHFVAGSPEGRRYERLAGEIDRALAFMAACGIDLAAGHALQQVDLWTSHEALLLDYEEALTRRDPTGEAWYGCSAHMLWIGERTRDPDGAHVAYCAGIENPIGLKVGPDAALDEIVEVCARLDPERVPGRLTLIPRLGAGRVTEKLPPIIRAIRSAGHPVVWVCDPMHGNGIRTTDGVKTRSFEAIMWELQEFVMVCRAEGVWPGGVHIEFTGEDVTECTGGSHAVSTEELGSRYMTLCDPRLNARQSLDLAFQLGELLRSGRDQGR